MLILLDCDGVLADFVGASLKVIEERMGLLYKPEQVTDWDFKSLPAWSSIEPHFWKAVKETEGFCAGIEPFPGAREAVERLRLLGEVEVITSPMHGCKTWAFERDEWLERHFGFHHRDVHHVRKKFRVPADVIVDDHTVNLSDWMKTHPTNLALLWDQPYNRGPASKNMVRARTWNDVENYVRFVKKPADLTL